MDAGRRIAAVLAGLVLLVAGCGDGDERVARRRRRVDLAASRRRGATDGLDRVERARRRGRGGRAAAGRAGAARRRAARSAPRCAGRCLSGRDRAAGARPLPRRAGRRPHGGAAARRARARPSSRPSCAPSTSSRRGHRLTPSRFAAVFLNLRRNTRTWTQESFPLAGERGAAGRRPRRPAVHPGPRHAAAPARHLGQDQLAAAPLPDHARRSLPRAQPAAPARRARAAARAAQRFRRLGVLLRVRAGPPRRG